MTHPLTDRDATRAAARQAAGAAARAAGVDVRVLDTTDELRDAESLMRAVWRSETPPVSLPMMRAIQHAGGYVAGAYDAAASLVGATVGFLGSGPAGPVLHSHAAGVDSRWRGRGLGFALKQHQRSWALDHELCSVTWTFDPLVRRNAVFNLVKLGAQVDDYLPNFYGAMHDGLNSGDETDRFAVRWPLSHHAVVAAALGRTTAPADQAGRWVALSADLRGRPQQTPGPIPADAERAVWIPPDIELVRGSAPAVALEWRLALRDVIQAATEAGHRVSGITRQGCYVLRKVDS